MAIYVTHGIVEQRSAAAFADRNMLDVEAFAQHLLYRASRYVPLEQAQRGLGDALTVDDSTVAAADACRVARDLKHDVTFFINPANIVEERTYFFARLDAALDRSEAAGAVHSELRAFRRTVKARLLAQATDADLERIVDAALAELCVPAPDVPGSLCTISVEVVRDLADRGVSIANHGWSHVDPANLTGAEFQTHITRATEWIAEIAGRVPTAYGVPFGETPLTAEKERAAGADWYLADDSVPGDRHGAHGWNRRTLVIGDVG
jgi:hypothetical protein